MASTHTRGTSTHTRGTPGSARMSTKLHNPRFPDEDAETQRGKGSPEVILVAGAKQGRNPGSTHSTGQSWVGWGWRVCGGVTSLGGSWSVFCPCCPAGWTFLTPCPLLMGRKHEQDFIHNCSTGFDFKSRGCSGILCIRPERKTTMSCNSHVILSVILVGWVTRLVPWPPT